MEQEQLNVKTPEYVSLQFQLAGLGSRSAAQIIDYTIILLTQFLIILLLFFAFNNSLSDLFLGHLESVMLAIIIIIILLLQFGYFIFFEYFWGGRTIGKRLLGIRVVQENGHNITLLSSIIRNFVRVIDMLPSAYAVGIILIFFHSKHKRLGDMTAGTIVVHERRKKPLKQSPLEKHIVQLGIQKEELQLESFHLRQFNQKDWRLLQTYVHRILHMSAQEKNLLTKQVSEILLPKIKDQMQDSTKNNEVWLVLLYLHLKDEWEYDN
ncbi:RDD family protein [Gracilibacillus salitolerans]|uniref:RDD family protein n=1 Tax=Gracilibacillus salitolerans TaxID=2663022 RepID=A0A5Q2THZ1_9BACI|nr:RDD family protein [Gracilibacillus salitolerans]QGH33028.1 RDD family protein [Gracilibacillus salitolerans]